MIIKSDPRLFTDSPRYFIGYGNSTSFWDEVIVHTGRNIQTLLFSLANLTIDNQGKAALLANLSIWFLVATSLLYFIEKNIKNNRFKFYLMVATVLVFTSNIIALWITAVLSESIALSFMIFTVTISALTIFKEIEIEKSRNWILLGQILLFLSQPIWAVITLPLTFFAFIDVKKYFKQLIAIGLVAFFSMTIATLSHRLPYENTGLTFKGFESLTRAYFYSLPGRFEDVALGKTIKECPTAYQLLLDAETQGTPTPLFFGFKDATSGCPEVVEDMNAGKSNSIPNMLLNNPKNSAVMTALGFYAIANQEANQQNIAFDSISTRPIGKFVSDLFIPFGIFLAPVTLLLMRNRKEILFFTTSNFLAVAAGLLLYFQVGIEGERHTLPAAVILGLTNWLVVIRHLYSKTEKTIAS
jgi:hypothetical protein